MNMGWRKEALKQKPWEREPLEKDLATSSNKKKRKEKIQTQKQRYPLTGQ